MLKFEDIKEVYDKLVDEESKRVFGAYLNLILYRNYDSFMEELIDYNKDYIDSRWNEYKANTDVKEIIIWGAGLDGIRTYKLLKSIGENVVCFADNSETKQGKELIDNLKVFGINEVIKVFPNAIHLLASQRYCNDIYEQLLIRGISREKIYYPPYRKMVASTGKQYFDCPNMEPMDEEVFIDGGSYDGATSLKFIDWCKGNYKQILAFEPDTKCIKSIENTIAKKNIENTKIYNACLGNKTGNIPFCSTGLANGTVSKDGRDLVSVYALDDLEVEDRVTFIKLDIEGSELSAISGMEKIIKRDHPRLAICVYHKHLDFLEIPLKIMEISNDYRLYLRHYSNCEWETVLYAI